MVKRIESVLRPQQSFPTFFPGMQINPHFHSVQRTQPVFGLSNHLLCGGLLKAKTGLWVSQKIFLRSGDYSKTLESEREKGLLAVVVPL